MILRVKKSIHHKYLPISYSAYYFCGLNSGKFSCLTLEWPLVLVLFILALAFIPAFTKTRRLPPPLKRKAEDLLGMKVNKKMLQQQLSVESGRVVTLADLTLKIKKPYQFDSENKATDIPQ